MKSIHILALLIVGTLAVCFSGQTIAQNKQSDASISGHIIDAKTGEHLPYVTVMVGGTQIGIQTSSSGHYVLRNLPLGKHDIIASFVGYNFTRHRSRKVLRSESQPRRGISLA